jgi:hypothetical protein
MQVAGSSRTKVAVRSATPATRSQATPSRATPSRAPSWGRVLATTIHLWTTRRVPRMRHPWLVLFVAVSLVIAGAAVVGAIQLTATSVRTASPGSPHRAPARAGVPARAGTTPGGQAAAWIAGQVSSNQSIACDTRMCAALAADGVASGRLVPLASAATAPGASVVVTSPAGTAQVNQDAPVLLASFGTGASQVEVRAAAPGGAAAYAKALQADLAARRSGGAQLLHSQTIQVSAQAAGQLQAGQVDSRLLIMLAMLASQHSWRVVAFGGASPGVPLADAPLRQMIIAGPDAKAVSAALAVVRAQLPPYAPAQATTVRLAGGPPGLRIDFAAPGPLGLLAGAASS